MAEPPRSVPGGRRNRDGGGRIEHPGLVVDLVRIERELTGNSMIIRAEMPGIDPDKDIEITLDGGVLPSVPTAGPRRRRSRLHPVPLRLVRATVKVPDMNGGHYRNGLCE